MDALSKCERIVYDIIRAGPDSGMTSREIFEAQTASEYSMSTLQNHGIKLLKMQGMVVPIGSRARMNAAGTQRTRQTLWLDADRARGRVAQEIPQETIEEAPQQALVRNVSDLIATRLALTEYLQKAIAEDGGQAEPSWLARLLVRDWDIKPRETQ